LREAAYPIHSQIFKKRRETPPLGKNTDKKAGKSRVTYEVLEEAVRMKVGEFIQDILEEEITEFLGRRKSERIRRKIDTHSGYQNGYEKPRRLALMNGTIRIRRPRLRNAEEFESKVLPLFKRSTADGNVLFIYQGVLGAYKDYQCCGVTF